MVGGGYRDQFAVHELMVVAGNRSTCTPRIQIRDVPLPREIGLGQSCRIRISIDRIFPSADNF